MPHTNLDKLANSRGWKAITFSYDRVLAQEENSNTLHCLSATTRLLLLSVLDLISWKTRYDKDDETILQSKITEWYEKAAYELAGGWMLRGENCKLEISCDGVNWETLIDFASCIVANSDYGDANIYEHEIDELEDDYVDSPTDIGADDVVYDDSEDDDYRDIALCLAIRAWIDAIARTWVKKDQGEDSRKRLIASAGLFFATGVLALVTGGVALLVAGAIGSAIALIAINIDLEDETLLYADEVLDAVQCCIYLNLAGSTPTEEDFQNSAQGCEFDEDSYEESLALIVDAVNNEGVSQYLSFLKLWDETYAYAEQELIEQECDECDPGWHMQGDLTLAALPEFITVEIGNHVEGTGVEFVCSGGSPQTKEAKVRLQLSGETMHVTRSSVDYEYGLGSTFGSSVNQGVYDGTILGNYEVWHVWEFGEIALGPAELYDTTDLENCDRLQWRIRSSRNACNGWGELYMLYVRGTGDNPLLGESGWEVRAE